MAFDKSQKQKKRWSKKQGIRANKFISRHWWISVISRVRASISKLQRQSRTPRWHCERFQIIRSIYWTRIINITDDSRKSHGHHFLTTGMRRTSSRRSIRLYPGQNGRCTDFIENYQVRMSRYLDTSSETQMAQIMVQYGRSSPSSWAKSVRSSFGRTIMGTAIRESSIEVRLGKSSELGMFLFVHREKGSFLFVYVNDKISWKETEH